MHLLGVLSLGCSLAAATLGLLGAREPATAAAYESGQGYYEEEPELLAEAKQAYASKELEEQLRSVSSVDELMTVLYPEYWKMFKCQLRKGSWQHSREQSSFDARSEDSNPIKFAAAHYNADILKSIDNEWRKTQCMPREVCVDVGKEFGATTNTFFKPPCVSIYRCGGCCNSEGLQCMNISTSYISKTLFEITVPLSHGPKPVTISFANHTSCRCMSKLDVYRQVHSIIRRSLPLTQQQCHVANKTCPKSYIWNNHICRCLAQHDFSFSSHTGDTDSAEGFHDICGPNKELDEETCQCVCKGGVRPSSCGAHKELDRTSCQCTCKNKLLPSSCGPNRDFDEERCHCVCKRTCPKHQPLNPAKCICECVESPNKCFLKGKRFHQQTCRVPIRRPIKDATHLFFGMKMATAVFIESGTPQPGSELAFSWSADLRGSPKFTRQVFLNGNCWPMRMHIPGHDLQTWEVATIREPAGRFCLCWVSPATRKCEPTKPAPHPLSPLRGPPTTRDASAQAWHPP